MIKKLLFLIWPPYEAYLTHKEIDRKLRELGDKARFAEIVSRLTSVLPSGVALDGLEDRALNVQRSEMERNEAIESKAAALTGNMAIAVAIVSIVPMLFKQDWGLPNWCAISGGTAYLLAIIHLLVGIYYAIKVRKVQGYEVPCVKRLMDLLQDKKWQEIDRAVAALAQTEWNEPILTKKANLLMVAEALSLRGLALMAFGAVFSILAKLVIRP
jgi:hypothetical protein